MNVFLIETSTNVVGITISPVMGRQRCTTHYALHVMSRWVPAEWLTQWANGTDNVPFQKDALLCKDHSKLDPNKVTGMIETPSPCEIG